MESSSKQIASLVEEVKNATSKNVTVENLCVDTPVGKKRKVSHVDMVEDSPVASPPPVPRGPKSYSQTVSQSQSDPVLPRQANPGRFQELIGNILKPKTPKFIRGNVMSDTANKFAANVDLVAFGISLDAEPKDIEEFLVEKGNISK